jgi:hypothetical protein
MAKVVIRRAVLQNIGTKAIITYYTPTATFLMKVDPREGPDGQNNMHRYELPMTEEEAKEISESGLLFKKVKLSILIEEEDEPQEPKKK